MKFSSLAALEVVILTTFSVASDEVSKFGFNVHGHNIGHIIQLSPNQVD